MTKNAHGDEVVARRKTADDRQVALWSDGSLTWGGLGTVIKGSANARTPAQREEALAAGRLVLGDLELYDADDVPDLIKAARKVARFGGTAGDMRRDFAKTREPKSKPVWQVLEVNRAGEPTLRVWRLSRLSHPGLAVWDDKRAPGAGRGRYHVMVESSGRGRGTYHPTGVQFHDLTSLAKYLDETKARR